MIKIFGYDYNFRSWQFQYWFNEHYILSYEINWSKFINWNYTKNLFNYMHFQTFQTVTISNSNMNNSINTCTCIYKSFNNIIEEMVLSKIPSSYYSINFQISFSAWLWWNFQSCCNLILWIHALQHIF